LGPQTPSLHYLYKKSTVQKNEATQVAVHTCDDDPQHFDADPDPHFYFDAGPEQITFPFDADPDQDPTLYSKVSEF
jgi:hypothetical protein